MTQSKCNESIHPFSREFGPRASLDSPVLPAMQRSQNPILDDANIKHPTYSPTEIWRKKNSKNHGQPLPPRSLTVRHWKVTFPIEERILFQPPFFKETVKLRGCKKTNLEKDTIILDTSHFELNHGAVGRKTSWELWFWSNSLVPP